MHNLLSILHKAYTSSSGLDPSFAWLVQHKPCLEHYLLHISTEPDALQLMSYLQQEIIGALSNMSDILPFAVEEKKFLVLILAFLIHLEATKSYCDNVIYCHTE